MGTANYEKGKVKVVWINDDPEQIFSRMFDSEERALEFAGRKDNYVIFSLESQKHMEEFSWKILPYGKYKLYKTLVKGATLL